MNKISLIVITTIGVVNPSLVNLSPPFSKKVVGGREGDVFKNKCMFILGLLLNECVGSSTIKGWCGPNTICSQ